MADYMTEAVEACYRAYCAARKGAPLVSGEYEAVYSRIEDKWITEALTAAAPIIERATATRLGERFEEMAADVSTDPLADDPEHADRLDGIRTGYLMAARECAQIARGQA